MKALVYTITLICLFFGCSPQKAKEESSLQNKIQKEHKFGELYNQQVAQNVNNNEAWKKKRLEHLRNLENNEVHQLMIKDTLISGYIFLLNSISDMMVSYNGNNAFFSLPQEHIAYLAKEHKLSISDSLAIPLIYKGFLFEVQGLILTGGLTPELVEAFERYYKSYKHAYGRKLLDKHSEKGEYMPKFSIAHGLVMIEPENKIYLDIFAKSAEKYCYAWGWLCSRGDDNCPNKKFIIKSSFVKYLDVVYPESEYSGINWVLPIAKNLASLESKSEDEPSLQEIKIMSSFIYKIGDGFYFEDYYRIQFAVTSYYKKAKEKGFNKGLVYFLRFTSNELNKRDKRIIYYSGIDDFMKGIADKIIEQ